MLSFFKKKPRLPSDDQVRIVTGQCTKEELERLLQDYELTATELNLVGTAFRDLDEMKLAEGAYRESIEADRGYDEPYGNLISLYCLQERYDEGRAVAEEALNQARRDPYIWYHFGRLCFLCGDYYNAYRAAMAALDGEDYEFEAAYALGVRALFSKISQRMSDDPDQDLEEAHRLLVMGLGKFPESSELQDLAKIFSDD